MVSHEELKAITNDLSVKQSKILTAIQIADRPAKTNDITSDEESITNQDVGYHAKGNLVERGLVEHLGKGSSDQGGEDPNIYDLTDLGEEVATEIRRAKPASRSEEIDEERLKSIEQDIDRLFRLFGDLNEFTDVNREAIKELRDRVDGYHDSSDGSTELNRSRSR